ncbi:hypothetical protein X946_2280 [Burkholderia sp. ABCPW 111]|nr:hypothetical protein X946_2280 [Burkholderia sp. ABCPW 111]
MAVPKRSTVVDPIHQQRPISSTSKDSLPDSLSIGGVLIKLPTAAPESAPRRFAEVLIPARSTHSVPDWIEASALFPTSFLVTEMNLDYVIILVKLKFKPRKNCISTCALTYPPRLVR